MKTWPNWIDLIIITLLFKGAYVGFTRGLLAEILNVVGAVSVTALAVNYWHFVAPWVRPWLWVGPPLADFLVFGAVFVVLLLAVHIVLRRVTEFIKWERLHWGIQGLGLILGGLRGLWWSGVIVVILVSSGFTYLRESVEERSVFGPRLVTVAREGLERIADRFPGAEHRGGRELVPPIKVATKSAPKPTHESLY